MSLGNATSRRYSGAGRRHKRLLDLVRTPDVRPRPSEAVYTKSLVDLSYSNWNVSHIEIASPFGLTEPIFSSTDLSCSPSAVSQMFTVLRRA